MEQLVRSHVKAMFGLMEGGGMEWYNIHLFGLHKKGWNGMEFIPSYSITYSYFCSPPIWGNVIEWRSHAL